MDVHGGMSVNAPNMGAEISNPKEPPWNGTVHLHEANQYDATEKAKEETHGTNQGAENTVQQPLTKVGGTLTFLTWHCAASKDPKVMEENLGILVYRASHLDPRTPQIIKGNPAKSRLKVLQSTEVAQSVQQQFCETAEQPTYEGLCKTNCASLGGVEDGNGIFARESCHRIPQRLQKNTRGQLEEG